MTNWSALRDVFNVDSAHPTTECASCALRLYVGTPMFRVPGLRGAFCSIACVETKLFGWDSCRWCGTEIAKPYSGIGSRLCSDDCEQSYRSHVRGDRRADNENDTFRDDVFKAFRTSQFRASLVSPRVSKR